MIHNILAPIFVFALIVLVHEGGHFLTAKLTGMRVTEFAVGFGPKVASRKWGETLYSLRAFPLGGFNRISGMDGESGDPRGFAAKPVWARLLVIAAGSLFNVLLAFVIFTGVYMVEGYNTFPNLPVVGSVLEGTSAARSGLAAGDKILMVNGKPMGEWTDIGKELADKPGRIIPVEIERNGEHKTYQLIPEDRGEGRAIIGISPYLEHHDAGVLESIRLGGTRLASLFVMMVRGFYALVTGGGVEVAGPIGVVRLSAQAADDGFTAVLLFTALISLNLGFLNLLPIPLLDGGIFFMTLIEAVIRRKLPPKALHYIQMVGIAILGGIFLFAMVNDIGALLR